MNVLIIGFGTIGKIKARVWKSKNLQVLIYDKNRSEEYVGMNKDYAIVSNLNSIKHVDYIDICTPSGTHVSLLKEILKRRINFENVLIEKPLFSSFREFSEFRLLIKRYPQIIDKLIVSEQYAFSKILNLNIDKPYKKITITMSKNRLLDFKCGRFFDETLGPYGIELPHIIAILRKINVDIASFHSIVNKYFIDPTNIDNCGVYIEGYTTDVPKIIIKSFLGNYNLDKNLNYKANVTNKERNLLVENYKNQWKKIEFDPIKGLPSLTNRIITNNYQLNLVDNMIDNLISLIIKNQIKSNLNSIIPDNVLVCELRKHADKVKCLEKYYFNQR